MSVGRWSLWSEDLLVAGCWDLGMEQRYILITGFPRRIVCLSRWRIDNTTPDPGLVGILCHTGTHLCQRCVFSRCSQHLVLFSITMLLQHGLSHYLHRQARLLERLHSLHLPPKHTRLLYQGNIFTICLPDRARSSRLQILFSPSFPFHSHFPGPDTFYRTQT